MRLHVWVYANVETSRDAYERQCVDDYETTAAEFLASAIGEDFTEEDLSGLSVGQKIREGNVKVERLS